MTESTSDEGWVSPDFAAGRFHFRVAADPEFRVLVLRAFEGLSRSDNGEVEASFAIRLAMVGGASWNLIGPNCPQRPISSRVAVLDALVSAVSLTALDLDPAALHLHAAAVSRSGEAVVVIGESGSGKTTLAATLASSGWDYITDEMVRLAPGDVRVTGFAKPLSVRSSGSDLLPKLSSEGLPLDDLGSTFQFSPQQLGATVVQDALPRVLLLCSAQASGRRGCAPTARKISPADAVVRMMGQTMDAERFGSRAIEVLGHLASRCGCYEFDVGEPELMVSLIDRLIDEADDDPSPLEVVPSSGAIADDVITAFIGENSVVHHGRTGLVLALDAPASELWRQVGGLRPHGDPVDLDGPVESRFVAQLSSLGLLAER